MSSQADFGGAFPAGSGGPTPPVSAATISTWLEALKHMVGSLGPRIPFQTSLTALLGMLSHNLGFERPHLVLFEPETGLLRLSLAQTPPMDSQAIYNPGEGVTGQVFATGKPVIVERLAGHPVFLNRIFQRTPAEMDRLSFISVPVLTPSPGLTPPAMGEVIGTLNTDAPFVSRADLENRCLFLEVIASLIANEAAHLQEDMARRRRLVSAMSPELSGTTGRGEPQTFVAQSKVVRHILEQAAHLAQSRGPVLLRGEAGVGKGRLASRIHAMSPRRDMPLLTYHCAAMPPEAMEADLRGYLKGGFPGAIRTTKGLFEQGNMGTIFLDAVETLTPEAQAALTRLLANHEVLRMGAADGIPVDVRVIAASGADLEAAADSGGFSRELLTRLGASSLHLPPLRERREDIIPLAEFTLGQTRVRTDAPIKRISYPALELLTRYYWPGNVSELKHCMERAALNSEDMVIRAKDLPPSVQTAQSSSTESELSLKDAVARYEKELLVDALIKAGGNMLKAARDLKSSYRIVNYKVKKYNIDPHQFTFRHKPL